MRSTKVLRGGIWTLQSREFQFQEGGTRKKGHRGIVASLLCCTEHRWHLAHATPTTTPTPILSVLRAKTGLHRPGKSLTGLPYHSESLRDRDYVRHMLHPILWHSWHTVVICVTSKQQCVLGQRNKKGWLEPKTHFWKADCDPCELLVW